MRMHSVDGKTEQLTYRARHWCGIWLITHGELSKCLTRLMLLGFLIISYVRSLLLTRMYVMTLKCASHVKKDRSLNCRTLLEN